MDNIFNLIPILWRLKHMWDKGWYWEKEIDISSVYIFIPRLLYC